MEHQPPGEARALYKRANELKDRGEWQAALADYDRAIGLYPGYAHALCNRGAVLTELRRLDEALQSYDRALAIDAGDDLAHYNRGLLLQHMRQWHAALAAYERAIALNPNSFLACFHRGNVLRELERWDAALASYERAIAIAPERAEAHFNRGVLLQKAGRLQAALDSYERAVALHPGLFQALFNRGNVLAKLKRPDAALASYDAAIAACADYPEAYSHRGAVLQAQGRWDEARASYDRAIELRPDFAAAYFNRGTLHKDRMQWQAALADYDRALALQPDFADALYNKSLLLLMLGDFATGWRLYEWRWKNAARLGLGDPQRFTEPSWLGSGSLAGKRVLVWCEQGLGDTLQFCRYVQRVAELGAQVIFEVQRPLAGLLASLDGVSEVVPNGDPVPPFDHHCPLLSLPLAFGTTLQSVPAPIGYVRSDPAKVAQWRARLGPRAKPRIGLAWSGSKAYAADDRRSVPLADWIPHLPREFEYFCLQKDIRDADRHTLGGTRWIVTQPDELAGFSDIAALMMELDVVLSVDTSIAHLAGALGRRTWLLQAQPPDWRWMLEREDTPWYPTVRLFRQPAVGDWQRVFVRIAAELHGHFDVG